MTILARAAVLPALLILAAPTGPALAGPLDSAAATAGTPAGDAKAAAAAVHTSDAPPSAADADAARFCRNIHFVAYSTVPPTDRKVEESITWDGAGKRYIIRGPVLAYMLDDPGVASFPPDSAVEQTTFQIAIRKELSRPVDRFCESNFQESAYCDTNGAIYYTQVYSDCDLQTLKHTVRLMPDHAGALQLIDISFEDVAGEFSQPIDLSEGTDLRLRVRN